MNIKLAPGLVRMRISSDEARLLKETGVISQEITLAQGGLAIEVSLVDEQDEAAKFFFDGKKAVSFIRRGDFEELLIERPSRENYLSVVLPSSANVPIEFQFEVDLFTRKKRMGSGA